MTRKAASADRDAIAPAEFAACFAGLSDSGAIVAAVSGGPDSTALMHALAGWAGGRPGPRVHVATVDHGLRAGSRAEAEEVGTAAARLGLPHAILTWTTRPPGPASQDAARRARYGLLVAHAQAVGATHMATAHTLDDQAETILMRMAAGSGIAGLAGMAPVTSRGGVLHARPFLGLAKARLVATCQVQGWRFVADPTNRDPRYARTRWRTLLPGLAGEGLDAARLARLSARAARADAALAALALAAFDRIADVGPDFVALGAERLAAEPDEIALRVLALALRAEKIASGGGARESLSPRGRGFPAVDTESDRSSLHANPQPVQLERLEACLAALIAAHRAGRPLRRTLAGRLLALGRDGRIAVTPEPPRRRGRHADSSAWPADLHSRRAEEPRIDDPGRLEARTEPGVRASRPAFGLPQHGGLCAVAIAVIPGPRSGTRNPRPPSAAGCLRSFECAGGVRVLACGEPRNDSGGDPRKSLQHDDRRDGASRPMSPARSDDHAADRPGA